MSWGLQQSAALDEEVVDNTSEIYDSMDGPSEEEAYRQGQIHYYMKPKLTAVQESTKPSCSLSEFYLMEKLQNV